MSRVVWLIGLIAAALATVAVAPPSAAQTSGGAVNAIRVEGNQRIEAATVESHMAIRVGDPFDAERIDQSLKRLFATGLFVDVNLVREGNTLVVRVVENAIINRVAFEGNKRIDDELLADEVSLRARKVYSRTKLQNDVARIVEIYRRSGRFAATVEPKLIQLPQNRVDLVFEIDEGPATEIERISFIGNRRFSDGDLRDVISTKETVWYRFLSTTDSYDPDRLTFDRELLRAFYLSRGYADFRVITAVAELTRDRTGFFITFTVEEGERYQFGSVDIESRLRDLSVDQLFEQVQTVSGDWYDADLVEDSIQDLTETVSNLGFAFVDIRPRMKRDRQNRIIDLVYEIAEGPRVFVERINVTGNSRTLDEVVRREFRLVEGDAFNAAKIRRSRQRIRNLGIFDSVDVAQSAGSSADKAIIDVEVAETSTGQLTLGAGVSSLDGPLADISIGERNLLGRGQNLGLAFSISARRQQIDLSFTEPYFLDREVSAGFDIFASETDLTDQGTFDKNAAGLVLRGGYPITERLNHSVRYRLQRSEIKNIDIDASPFIQADTGTRTTSAVGHALSYDVRDSRFDPTEGYVLRLDQEIAGLGGRARYLRHKVSGSYHYPIFEGLIGTLSSSVGHAIGLFGEDLRIDERFFIGGETLRGFANAGIGPRDIRTNDPLGGNFFATMTGEVGFPIDLVADLVLRGRFFTDIGTLTDVDVDGPDLRDDGLIRASIGFGFSYVSPFGPILMDFGFPVLSEDFDETETIRLSFGTRF